MRTLCRVSAVIDRCNTWIGRMAAWALLVAIVLSATNAVVRKVIGVSSNAWLELQWYLFGAVFMLCAAWVLNANEHLRIDILSNSFSKRTRNIIDLIGHALFLGSFCFVMIYTTGPFVWSSFTIGEVSTNPGGLIIWPAKLVILLGFILLALQGVSELTKRVAIMRGLMPETRAGGGHGGAGTGEESGRDAGPGSQPAGQ